MTEGLVRMQTRYVNGINIYPIIKCIWLWAHPNIQYSTSSTYYTAHCQLSCIRSWGDPEGYEYKRMQMATHAWIWDKLAVTSRGLPMAGGTVAIQGAGILQRCGLLLISRTGVLKSCPETDLSPRSAAYCMFNRPRRNETSQGRAFPVRLRGATVQGKSIERHIAETFTNKLFNSGINLKIDSYLYR